MLINTATKFAQAFRNNSIPTVQDLEVYGLVGRLLRGRRSEDFETLTDDPANRKIIQLTDSTGLNMILKMTTIRAQLNSLGWDNKFIDDKLHNGYQFKMIVFPAEGSPARRSWWYDQMEVCGQAWPQLAQLFRQQPLLNLLRLQSWQDWDSYCYKAYGMGISQLPESHPIRMKPDDLAKNFSPLAVRVFLYYYAQLKELFSGDGWTYDNCGLRQLPEYCMANQKCETILDSEMIDIVI